MPNLRRKYSMENSQPEIDLPVRLFSKSVLKQRKLKELLEAAGSFDSKRCLDSGLR